MNKNSGPIESAFTRVGSFFQASVSLDRLNKYMNLPELKDNVVNKVRKDQRNGETKDAVSRPYAIQIQNSTFKWDADAEKPCLEDVSLDVKKGSLVAVVGQVGAGKSSLLSSILGELDVVRRPGEDDGVAPVTVDGSVAYVAQQAWIQNATVKSNVLFHRPLDGTRYKRVLEACALVSDLEILQAGDETEIGEKGINLSGGQKQRVSLARAAYSDSDIYLLDDPLSAVDSHVGKHIFDHVIGPQGLLAKKTRILVTHGLTHLKVMDEIIVITDGKISERGTYQDLLEKKGAFADFMVQYLSQEEPQDDEELEEMRELEAVMGKEELESKMLERRSSERKGSDASQGSTSQLVQSNGSVRPSREGSPRKRVSVSKSEALPKKAPNKQYEAEKSETGKVSFKVYLYYAKAIGVFMSGSCVLWFTVHQAFSAFSSVWLADWSDSNVQTKHGDAPANGTHVHSDTAMYLGVYGALGVGQAVGIILASIFLYLGSIRGAVRLHDNMLANVLRSSMTFFDTTPQGRILNRFSKDIDVLDATMPMVFRGAISCLLGVLATFVIITYTTPIFLLPIAVLMCGYYIIQK